MKIYTTHDRSVILKNRQIKKSQSSDESDSIFSKFLIDETENNVSISPISSQLDNLNKRHSKRQIILTAEDILKKLKDIQINLCTGKVCQDLIESSSLLINYTEQYFQYSDNTKLWKLLQDVKLRLMIEMTKLCKFKNK